MGLGPKPLDLDGLRKFYDGLWKAFPDLQIRIEDIVGENETVAWRLSVNGTYEAEFRGVARTGRKVTFTAQSVFRFRKGKIVERWTNLDRLGVLAQLGAITAPAA
jgi:predicted ester cyclase